VDQELDVDEQSGTKTGGVQPLEVVRFVLVSARKHWVLALGLFLIIGVPGALVARVLPLEFGTRARILVVSKEGIRARVTGADGERNDELAAVQDKLLRLDSLRAIVRDMKLEESWSSRRPPLLALKDRLRGGMENLSPEVRMRALMGTVASKVSVNADSYAGVITIDGRWYDPQTAYDLVQTVKNRFLQDRLRNDVQVFEEVIEILEQQKRDAGREVEQGLGRVEQAGWRKAPGEAAATGIALSGSPSISGTRLVDTVKEVGTPDPADVAKLEAVRRKIREVQDPWQRRLTELKLQLSDLNAHYGPKHPLVVNQENRIQEASAPPAGLDALMAEESQLGAAVEDASRPRERIVIRNLNVQAAGESPEKASSKSPADDRIRVENSATLSTEQSKLIQAVNKYNALVDRIDKTRVELNIASTAFKYRFNVVEEPEVPTGPLKPKMPLFVMVGSLALGALVALLVGAIRELIGGKLVAPWQAKSLGVPLLGELCLADEDGKAI
jgi:uncharacterized protein involved in exopolysaccharide biosynthesis